MKKFLFLILMAVTTIACVPTVRNTQSRDDNLTLGSVKYNYQLVNGHSMMIVQGIDQYGHVYKSVFPIDPSVIIDTVSFAISEDMFREEYKKFVNWYKENHYDDYYYETKEALDIVNQILSEYQKE